MNLNQRILLTIPNAVFSGSERQLIMIGRGLIEKGYNVSFCLLGGLGRIQDEIKKINCKYYKFDGNGAYFKKLFFYSKIIKSINPDLIISFNWAANNYTRLVKLIFPFQKFIHIAGERGRGMKNEKIKNYIDRVLHNVSNRIVTNSINQKEELVKYEKINPDKIDVIFNGLRLNKNGTTNSQKIRKKFLKGKFNKIICTASNFSEHKNIPLMLESLELLFNKTDEILFLFIGDSKDKQNYVDFVNDSFLLKKHIIFLGYRDNPLQIFLACDLFLFTSTWEGMPNVLIEAMSCGLPVITTPFDGSKELIINNKNGYVLNGFDRNEIVGLIQKVIYQKELLKAIGINAVESTKKFRSDRMIQSYIKIIKQEIR